MSERPILTTCGCGPDKCLSLAMPAARLCPVECSPQSAEESIDDSDARTRGSRGQRVEPGRRVFSEPAWLRNSGLTATPQVGLRHPERPSSWHHLASAGRCNLRSPV